MDRLNGFSFIGAADVARVAGDFGTPVYLYDENHILTRCRECLSTPNAYGLLVRYAMKANSNRSLLKIISGAGLHIDASSLNEAIRAQLAGIPLENIMLTTQETHEGAARVKLEDLMLNGLKYNVCSLRQLQLIADFAAQFELNPGIRIHPGVGSGESATRDTGDEYSCFGVHLSDVEEACGYAREKGIKFLHIHEHIGSGADSEKWRLNIDLEIGIIEKHFPDAESVGFGGGLKEARMPGEVPADMQMLGDYAKKRIEEFYGRTGRKLKMEIEPGTYIVANAGYAVTRVLDKKNTARSNFVIIDGGMEINARPLMYGSSHPMYIVSDDEAPLVRSSEFKPDRGDYKAVVAGKCCESGDCQTLDSDGCAVARAMAKPEIGDIAVIGGVGAYCSSMSPHNYNSHTQAPEVLFTSDGRMELIRKRQTIEQMLENEI
ncbi:MAG: diaminopimelate decarboxylase [Oscillospiraceae bacterium]|jgi:diaminopimelate decarboxylase|nr:diaminopimelate decarboxylase [Oscillospiraceae bacterium]